MSHRYLIKEFSDEFDVPVKWVEGMIKLLKLRVSYTIPVGMRKKIPVINSHLSIALLKDAVAVYKSTREVKHFCLDGRVFLAKCVHVYDKDTFDITLVLDGKLTKFRLNFERPGKGRLSNSHPSMQWLKLKLLNRMWMVKCTSVDETGGLIGGMYSDHDCVGQSIADEITEMKNIYT